MDAADRRLAGTIAVLAILIAAGIFWAALVLALSVRLFTLVAWGAV